jgi:hypothetical protein
VRLNNSVCINRDRTKNQDANSPFGSISTYKHHLSTPCEHPQDSPSSPPSKTLLGSLKNTSQPTQPPVVSDRCLPASVRALLRPLSHAPPVLYALALLSGLRRNQPIPFRQQRKLPLPTELVSILKVLLGCLQYFIQFFGLHALLQDAFDAGQKPFPVIQGRGVHLILLSIFELAPPPCQHAQPVPQLIRSGQTPHFLFCQPSFNWLPLQCQLTWRGSSEPGSYREFWIFRTSRCASCL